MYCSGCGSQIQTGLNYCNWCGKRVNDGEAVASIAQTMASSLGYIGGFGFLGYIFVALILVKNGVPPNYLVPITFFYFAALFGICYLILQQTQPFRRNPGPRIDDEVRDTPSYLRPVTTAQLPEGYDSPASVTEHTTRTLDELPNRRR